MRGKVTFRNGMHPSRIGEIIEPVTIGNDEWREIELALGTIDPDDRENITEYCAVLRGIMNDANVSAADVRETLEKISTEKIDAAVIDAFRNCDAETATQIDLYLYRLAGPDFFKVLPTLPAKQQATNIKAAACLASKEYQSKKGPRTQGWQRMAAEYAIQLAQWRGVMTTAHAFIEDDETPEPVIRILQTLLGIVNPQDSAQSASWCVKLIGAINARTA